ncbi:hypothetical protein A1D31_37445 [Bradyrhizobium liaoningense]|nr:hypothetical protein A1D31_37445 [Bradyrhizobium liaoningense]
MGGNDDGTYANPITSDDASSTFTYAASSTGYLVGLLSQELTNDSSANKVREAKHYYDGLTLGNVSAGNETKTEFWKSASSYASTSKAYDGIYGLVTQERDGNSNLTTHTLDTRNLYRATTTNALSQATGYTYDYSSGKVKNTFDPNNRLYVNAYDGFDRLLSVAAPDPATGSLATTTDYVYTDSGMPGATSVQKISRLNAATTTSTYTYLDGLGRQLQERTTAEDENSVSVKDWTYNGLGLVSSESLPYFNTGSPRTSATTNTALYSNYTYDPLLRVSKISNAVGSTTSAYDNWSVKVTDPNGKTKDFWNDAYGNLVNVVERVGANTSTTTYAWDLNRKLTNITDGLGNARMFTYDGMGRRLTAQDLHASGDASYGTWSYTYDDAGNIISITDPKPRTISATYDALNRKTAEDDTAIAGAEITYTYDSCVDGKMRLCSAVFRGSATTTYAYNPAGLKAAEAKTIDNIIATTSYSYDRVGNVTDIAYPDASSVRNTYNSGGLLESVSYKPNGGNYADVVKDFDYGPTGRVTYKRYQNNAQSFLTYDAAKLYRLANIRTTTDGMGGAEDLDALIDPDWVPHADLAPDFGLPTTTEEAIEPEIQDVLQDIGQPTSTPSAEDMSLTDMDLAIDDAATSSGALTGDEMPVEEPVVLAATSTESAADFATAYLANEQVSSEYQLEGSSLKKREGDVKITIGDVDSFTPKVKFEKWDDASIDIAYAGSGDLSAATVNFEENKIQWGRGDENVRFYDLSVSDMLPEGGYEIDVIYAKRPASNVTSFNIETQNLDFFYQPALDKTEQDSDVASCTATQCVNVEGNVVLERPENVVGSYAVYYKDGISGDYSEAGGRNYRTGKAFHIYRPRINDAAGNTTWGELNVDQAAGKLTVTVPQEFLDKATYPVIVDPTFGYNTIGASVVDGSDIVYGNKFALPENGQISSVALYTLSNVSGTSVKGLIYSDSTNYPGSLKVTGAGVAVSTSASWATSTLASPVYLGAGTYGDVPGSVEFLKRSSCPP